MARAKSNGNGRLNETIVILNQSMANLNQATELRPQLRGTAELVFGDGHVVPIARRHAAELAQRLAL